MSDWRATCDRAVLLLGTACGAIAPLWWMGMIAYCATQFPGYSHFTDYISELAARGSPTHALMRNWGFIATGVAYAVFGLSLGWRFRSSPIALVAAGIFVLASLARIGAGVFSCAPGCSADIISPDQDAHHRFAAVGYVLLMASAILWGAVGNRHKGLGHLMTVGLGVTTWSAVSLVMMYVYPAYTGLFQRGATALLSSWVVVLAVSLWRVRHAPFE